ncbi:MAG: tRNA-intron lyase [Candidatus Bathyarchaeota archaeon]|nr:MAG: tRNA-intron lyase [Candidatus Bathyarchaeota archaeon]
MKKKQHMEPRNPEIKKINGLFSEKGATILAPSDFESLTSRGYGVLENEKLLLNIYETLFLHSKGMLEVSKGESRGALTFQELLHQFKFEDKSVWAKYLIYRDLRSRGYVVREGFGLGINFRAYERGDYGTTTAAFLIRGIQEGKPISVRELARVLRHVQSLKKKLVLAVVNRRGEIVYYTLSKLTMKDQ